MRIAPSWLIAGSLVAPCEAFAVPTPAPSSADVLTILERLKLDQVRAIRCRTHEIRGMNMGGEPTAMATCTYRYRRTGDEGQGWGTGDLKLSYSGFPCGEPGQETDLICYNWQEDH